MDLAPLDDRGLTLGVGLFETILARDGELVLLDAHLRRITDGCGALGLPEDSLAGAEALCRQALAAAGLGGARAAVRLTLTEGSGGRGLDPPAVPAPRLMASAALAPAPEGPLRLVLARVRRNAGSPTSRLKTLSYLDNVLARREARLAGADEALMLNGEGELACAAAANLFWLADGRLATPALDCGVLDGVMRRRLIDRTRADGLAVDEVRAGPEALGAAEAVFITNSLIGIREAARVDRREITPHPLNARLAALLADVT